MSFAFEFQIMMQGSTDEPSPLDVLGIDVPHRMGSCRASLTASGDALGG
jgi:hypothetical protein